MRKPLMKIVLSTMTLDVYFAEFSIHI